MFEKTRAAEQLRDEIEVALNLLNEHSHLFNLVREPLSQPGRGLSTGDLPNFPLALLPLLVCEAVCGEYTRALPAAAALQFMLAAGDVFDDVEDADSADSLPGKYGVPLATSIATTLLLLAEKELVRLQEKGVDEDITIRIFDIVNSCYLTACIGQHLDLIHKANPDISEDEYLKNISLKSASQLECACGVGAILGNASTELVDLFRQFGHNLGMAAQIRNDMQKILKKENWGPEPCLPLIFALQTTGVGMKNRIRSVLIKSHITESEWADIRDWLDEKGALHYSAIKMESYRQRALKALDLCQKHGAEIEKLKRYLS